MSKPTAADRVEAESLLARVRAPLGRKAKIVTIEGKQGPVDVAFVVLNGTEVQLCHSRAVARFDELKIPLDYRRHVGFEEELSWQMFYECMREPDNLLRHVAKDTADVRTHFTEDERDVLMDRLLDWTEENSPDATELTPIVAEAVLEDIKKKDWSRLPNYDSRLLRYFLQLLGDQPQISTITLLSISSPDTDKP